MAMRPRPQYPPRYRVSIIPLSIVAPAKVGAQPQTNIFTKFTLQVQHLV